MGVVGTWRVPGYAEVRELGDGPWGRSVLVRHSSSGRHYVIRYLGAADAEGRRRFEGESAQLQQVFSPYVARWYGHLDEGDTAAVLLEAVDGVSLKDILTWHGNLSPEAALVVLRRSLLGLQEAHSRGVLHRDHTPSNVVVRSNGLGKLIGFGATTLAARGRSRAGDSPYVAPEQWVDEPAVPATDIYAATCVFFESLTGRPPFPGTMEAHLSLPVPLDQAPEVLHGLLASGLAKAPQNRPATAAEFAAEVENTALAFYGPEWEHHGLSVLASLARSLGTLLPAPPPPLALDAPPVG
ncbi:serine/threonine-protein kinase [Actinocorallia aurantiaca]|uniref:Protein kinase domain-containing protein n=1 Tax=Actinocorallia aurantiaca TaxID=46204 RepID=A0ABP6GUM6_9ACTN